MEIRLTAQLVLSNTEALLAYSVCNERRGANGETHTAALFQTLDAGCMWTRVSLGRTLVDRFRHLGFPTWPPEAIMELSSEHSTLHFVFRDEWVPFEPGGESLWRATQRPNGKWATSRIRYMDYDGADSPVPIPEVALHLPTAIEKPANDLFEELV